MDCFPKSWATASTKEKTVRLLKSIQKKSKIFQTYRVKQKMYKI